MVTLTAKELTINDVHQFLKWNKQTNTSFSSLLSLEYLTEFEQQELSQISQDFNEYLSTSKVSEGLVKALTTYPLMRLAGFYHSPIKISLEENIAPINIEDEGTIITGRMDILCVNKEQPTINNIPFWILVIEAKNSLAAPRAGLPQLLTYAHQSLDSQQSVWGLSTNGELYQFIYLQRDNQNNPNYQLLTPLTLLEKDSAVRLLQALKAICKLQIN
jgi:hypothetical protein